MKKANDINCIAKNPGGMIKAQRINTRDWIAGYHCVLCTDEDDSASRHYIIPVGAEISTRTCLNDVLVEINPETVCRQTGKTYMDKQDAYEGDIFKSQSCGLMMILQYGTFQAYCPADDAYMDSVGFYAEAAGYPQMPIGDISEYAAKTGNIFDDPGLATGILYSGENTEPVCSNNNNGWITFRPPENEDTVLVTVKRRCSREDYYMVVKAFYTDGNHNTDESNYCWEAEDFEYDEGTGTYMIPEGWWESTDYEEYFHEISDTVTAWRPLPEEYREINTRSDEDE